MTPPGWPAEVSDPDAEDFTDSAVRWLWDIGAIPRRPDSPWQRHPSAFAFRVLEDVEARLTGARTAYARARQSVGVDGVELDALLTEIEAEGAVLQRWRREAGLVAEALAGRRWNQRL